LMENGVEATLSLLAIAYIGAIVVPLFSGYGPDAIVSRLGSCGARAFVMTAGFRRRGKLVDTSALIDAVRQRLPLLEILILKSAAEHHPDVPGALDWATIESHGVVSSPSARMSSDDPFMVIYTSGTTGRPKGTVHTHGGFPLKIAHDAAVHFDVKPGDVFCWPADMGWVAGPLVACSALMRGATLVCYDGAPDFPDWSRMSRIIERYKVTQYGSSPTLIRGLAANEALALAGDVSSVRLLITAGETIDPEHFLWFQQSFGCGRNPLINYTGGGQSTRDSVGELAIREPFVGMTQSFWQDDERYLETYWRTVPGRWLHGDLAIHLSDGGFLLRGRSDDTLKVAGKRLGPAEVEEILLDLPAVSEVAAIGVDDPVKGQKLVVFVIPTGGTNQLELEALVGSRIEERLGRPFRPASVHVVTQLPKTKSLKVMRRVIRSIYTDQPAGDLSSLDNETALDEIRRVSPVHIA
jgi:acetyl-CoA synthetase